ncbi:MULTISPECIES: hypothetical protein [Pectobacterium]|uniref:Uncharacterized protein n=1 Tax=Pectobacterium polaris TaxID=2042057 RepID=A0AAW5GD07_9GAMM|nr:MULTISPECIES: hypothetical protein [Pectobacterium]MBN3195707.1 hypothetical protein [Pectobacterium versatile]MBN3215097.1 hypothetical protein [Pectobacterium polaris]MCL6351459.1 hypothetical protein [Pectobacterium polaris]MCL6368513.1 hypothetical protein [Pectobacterium polaris]TAI99324.1 hypothetical protein EG335_06395 [Pectobacterium versatile]
MDSISTLGSYAATLSGQSSLALNNNAEQQNVTNNKVVLTEKNIERQVVEISPEALAKFQAEVAKPKLDGATPEQLRTTAGASVVQPSEEELARRRQLASADINIEEYIAGHHRIRESDEAILHRIAVQDQMEKTYLSFLEQLADEHPDLQGAFFGFSVNKDGTLFVTQTDGLNREQINRLEKALNDSEGMVTLANQLADAQIAEFNSRLGLKPNVTLNRDTYGQTIDMGLEFFTKHMSSLATRDGDAGGIHKKAMDSTWDSQLYK